MAEQMNGNGGNGNGNGGGEAPPCPKTSKIFEDCKKQYGAKRDQAESNTKVAYTADQTSQQAAEISLNLYDCAYKANERYITFNHGISSEGHSGVSVSLTQDIIELEACIKGTVEKDIKLEAALKEAVKAIREAKDAMADMFEVACGLESCVNDSKNSAQRQALVDTIVEDKDAGEEGFLDAVTAITQCAKATKDYADTAFEASVKVYSLNGYNSVEVLTAEGEGIKEKVTGLTEDIADNIKSNATELAEASKTLTTDVTTRSTTAYTLCKESGTWVAVSQVASYDDQQEIPKEDSMKPKGLKKLCEMAQSTFLETSDTTPPKGKKIKK